MKYYLVLLFTGLSLTVYSQSFEVKGRVTDKMNAEPLEAATIYIQSITDNALITYTISDQKGNFELAGRTKAKEVNLLISYNGYKKITRKISLNKATIDIGNIQIEELAEELQGVEVVGERAPITIKKDTLEFNVSSFKTKPDAMVEDLLKKLPGIEVDTDGKITVNGKEVNEVLVNGKPFFGSDLTIATKNLSKDIVDKIQITDTKSDSEKFTGRKSTSDNKSVNITLKKGKNKGIFGRVTAGYGTDSRYEMSGIGNYFNEDQRVSVLASSNNINSSGFSSDEVFDMMGNRRGNLGFRQGEGITTSSNIGANYVDVWGEGKEASADYFYAKSDTENNSRKERETILPDSHFFTETLAATVNNNDSHRASSKFEIEPDSTLKITIRPSFNYTSGFSSSVSSTKSSDEFQQLINESSIESTGTSDRRNFANSISIIKKIGSNGAYISARFRNRNIENNEEDFLVTSKEVFGSNASLENRNQFTKDNTTEGEWNLDLELRQPIVKNLFLDLNYEVEKEKQRKKLSIHNFNAQTNAYSDFDARLSSNLKTTSAVHRTTAGLNFEGDKLYASFSAGLLRTNLITEEFSRNTKFEKTFNDVALQSRIRYRMGRGKRISIRYNTESNTPSAAQLQPVADESNLTNIVTGNPNLDREYNHRINLGLSNFDFRSRTGIFVWANLNLTDHRITPITIIDEDLIRRSTYTNVDGNYDGRLGASFSKTIKRDNSSLKYRIRLSTNYSKRYNFSNGTKFSTQSLGVSPSLRLTYSYNDLIEIEPEYSVSFNKASYSLDRIEDRDFLSHKVGLRTTTYWPKNIVFGNDIQYNYNPDVAAGFDKGAIFWNMSLGLKILEEKGVVKLKVYDLLDSNINTRRSITADYIEDSQSTLLKRYFMLSFTYKVNRVGGKASRGRGRGSWRGRRMH